MSEPTLRHPDETGVVLVSGEGTILARSGPPSMVGPSESSIPGHLLGLYEGEDPADLAKGLADATRGDAAARRTFTVRAVDPEGPPRRFTLALHPVTPGLAVGVVAPIARDGALTALDALDRVWWGLSDAMAVTSADTGEDGPVILAANAAFADLMGTTPDELRATSLTRLLAPVHTASLAARIADQVLGAERSISELAALKTALGDEVVVVWELAPIRGDQGSPPALVCVLRDVTWARAADSGRSGVEVDPLSGLPNQVHFLSRLQRSVERAAQARQYAFAVVGLEMRGLRAIERRRGTLVSNTILEAMVRRLKLRLRPGDLVARTGDRRLAILLDYMAPTGGLEEVLSRIHEAAGDPFTVAGERVVISVVEVATPVWSGDRPPRDAQHVLDELEVAVQRAASKGTRDTRYERSGEGATGRALLSHAVEQGRLSLAYLPLVSLTSGDLTGLEALVQWAHPERGVLSGADFLEDATRAGLIVPIGKWVLREVCRQAREWESRLGPHAVPAIHVNLSASEFWGADLANELQRATEGSAASATRIRLEVPESAVARGVPAACRILDALRQAGFETWLDRFGEGGIRLCDLPLLPLHHVKLARELAWLGGAESGEPSRLLGSLVAMSHDFGWEASVAGVETTAQLQALRGASCDVAQGYYFNGLLNPFGVVAPARHPALGAPSTTHH